MSYRWLRPLLFRGDAETTHQRVAALLRISARVPGLLAAVRAAHAVPDPRLAQRVWGIRFAAPLGLAAGFDKNARLVPAMAALGFSFVEVGTVTPRPQTGTPRPRLFRLAAERSLVNRLGFNNDGAEVVRARLSAARPAVPVGVNLGKNRDTSNERALDDYLGLLDTFAHLADYLVINVSSPNTPGLRDLQSHVFVREVFALARARTARPVLLKIGPDQEPAQAAALASAAVAAGAAGVVATNTTADPELLARCGQTGGVSGRLLRERSFATLRAIAAELSGAAPIVSVGGIDSGAEAWRRLRAGATLLQLYTGLIFEGPGLARKIHRHLLDRLERHGCGTLAEAVGGARGEPGAEEVD